MSLKFALQKTREQNQALMLRERSLANSLLLFRQEVLELQWACDLGEVHAFLMKVQSMENLNTSLRDQNSTLRAKIQAGEHEMAAFKANGREIEKEELWQKQLKELLEKETVKVLSRDNQVSIPLDIDGYVSAATICEGEC